MVKKQEIMQKQEKKKKLINLYLKFLIWTKKKNFFSLNYNSKKTNLIIFFNNNFLKKNLIKFFFYNCYIKKITLKNNYNYYENFNTFFNKSIFNNNFLQLNFNKLSFFNKNFILNSTNNYLRLSKKNLLKKKTTQQLKTLAVDNYLNHVYYTNNKKNLIRYFEDFYLSSAIYTNGFIRLLRHLKKKKLIRLKKKNLILKSKKKINKSLNKKIFLIKKNLKKVQKDGRKKIKKNEGLFFLGSHFNGYERYFYKNFNFLPNFNTQIFLFKPEVLNKVTSRLIFNLQEKFNFKTVQILNDKKKFYFDTSFIKIFLNFEKALLFREKILKEKVLIRKFNCFFKLVKNNLFFTLTNIFNETIISFSCRTEIGKKQMSKRIINSIYYTLPRFLKKIKLRIFPSTEIENFFLPSNLMSQSYIIRNIFKKNKISINNIRIKYLNKHNNFLKLKKLSRKKRIS